MVKKQNKLDCTQVKKLVGGKEVIKGGVEGIFFDCHKVSFTSCTVTHSAYTYTRTHTHLHEHQTLQSEVSQCPL